MPRINSSKHLACILAAIGIFSCCAFATEGERHITLQEDVAKAELIKLNISAGEVQVTGITGKSLNAEVTASCQNAKQDACYKLIKDLSWSKKIGSITELELAPLNINRYDNVTIKVKISVPQDKKLDLNLSAGELRVENTSACVTAAVNAGELNLKLKEAQLASAELSAKVGDVKLITPNGPVEGERSLLVGASLQWNQGKGNCHVKVNVMAGEAQLTIY